jgi:hypothetical protein
MTVGLDANQASPEVTVNQMVDGYATKSVAGAIDVTLTDYESTWAVLELTGAITASINVIVPTTKNQIAVYNNTSGAFTVTVKTTAGTGITVPQGQTALLQCDGTNVIDLINYFSSLLLGGDVATDTTTGSKIGTAVTQKLGLWGVTPVVQPASAGQAAVSMTNSDGDIGGLTISAAYSQSEVQALRDQTEILADDTRDVNALLTEIRTALVSIGAIKGSA